LWRLPEAQAQLRREETCLPAETARAAAISGPLAEKPGKA